jgi:hypothetical protein
MSSINNILDSDGLEEDYFKHRLAMTIVWLCYGVLTLFNAIETLYHYSRGGFFFDVTPIYFVYENMLIGLFSIVLSGSVFTKNQYTIRHLIVFLGALLILILTEYISYTREFASMEQAFLAICLIVVSWINYQKKSSAIGGLKNKLYFLIWSSFWGFLPLFLSWFIEYDDFRRWLHDIPL